MPNAELIIIQMRNVTNAEGARFPWRSSAERWGAENEPCCKQMRGYVSDVIYEKVCVIRLIIVSAFSSNYITVIYQIAR